jgi:hypothetical protein
MGLYSVDKICGVEGEGRVSPLEAKGVMQTFG